VGATWKKSFKTFREDIVNKHVCGFRSKVGELQLLNPLFANAGVGKYVVLNKHVKAVCRVHRQMMNGGRVTG
jgi:hypothetical protein